MRLLDFDPLSGIKTYFKSDGKYADDWTFISEYEVPQHEIEASKALQNHDDHWKEGVKNGWVHVAHIPNAILAKWHSMGVDINDPKALKDMCQRREWRYLMCVDKKV